MNNAGQTQKNIRTAQVNREGAQVGAQVGAQKLQELLDTELSKPVPDSDIVYALKQRLPYANTIDTEKIKAGNLKLNQILTELEK